MNKEIGGRVLAAVLLLGMAYVSCGFSPYEELTSQGKGTHVGLIAAATKGRESDLDKALVALADKKQAAILRKAGITNLSAYRKVLADGKTWYMIYFDYNGKNYLQAGAAFEKSAPPMSELLQPHPRAVKYGRLWLQMEWINHIRGVPDDKMPTRQMVACVTRVKPEKEEQYRILHQTVWPGVTDQMVRSNYRNFSIYFVEIGDELYELFYFEYVGSDIDADNNLSKEDPCTLRWWKLTDVCQNPLPDAKGGIWAAMDQVVPVPATK